MTGKSHPIGNQDVARILYSVVVEFVCSHHSLCARFTRGLFGDIVESERRGGQPSLMVVMRLRPMMFHWVGGVRRYSKPGWITWWGAVR